MKKTLALLIAITIVSLILTVFAVNKSKPTEQVVTTETTTEQSITTEPAITTDSTITTEPAVTTPTSI